MLNKVLGAWVTISRGAKGERPDFYAGTIVSEPKLEVVNGRPSYWAEVISLETTREGKPYLASAPFNLRFARPRTERVVELDGTAAAPLHVEDLIAKQDAENMAFLMSRPAASNEISLADIAEV